jgi:hypothetical protein
MSEPHYRPHLWVPYGPASEICTLCGEFLTPENGGASCPETIEDDRADQAGTAPAEPPDELPEGADEELRQGVGTPL